MSQYLLGKPYSSNIPTHGITVGYLINKYPSPGQLSLFVFFPSAKYSSVLETEPYYSLSTERVNWSHGAGTCTEESPLMHLDPSSTAMKEKRSWSGVWIRPMRCFLMSNKVLLMSTDEGSFLLSIWSGQNDRLNPLFPFMRVFRGKCKPDTLLNMASLC